MKTKLLKVFIVLCLTSFTSCSQNEELDKEEKVETNFPQNEVKKKESHRYGGWYCPDNLNGFPAVDINNWNSVPVVNGRMATKEETSSGASLIFVDAEKYPNAKPLDMTMPKLATFFNYSSNKDEYVIVIQALNIENDSIVGFRYLNGGNGSARLNEVRFLSDNEIEMIPKSQFVSHNININATQEKVWEILKNPKYAPELQTIFDSKNTLKNDWRKSSNVNFNYSFNGFSTAKYGDLLFGNYYMQNNFIKYTEKFLLLENREAKTTEFKIVCGPFISDFGTQKTILENWAKKVKELSETSMIK